MTEFRVLVTDLTEYGDLRCVAGWDIDRFRMVRPEPAPASFWSAAYCGPGKPFLPGNIVKFEANSPVPTTLYPHLTEDQVVQGTIQIIRTLTQAAFVDALKEIPSVQAGAAFAAPVEFSNGKAFIRTGTNCSSLVTLSTPKSSITFSEQNYDGKSRARCHIKVTEGHSVNLSLAATDIRQEFRAHGVPGIERLFLNAQNLHVRLGLARGFGNFQNRCYMQVNGMYAV